MEAFKDKVVVVTGGNSGIGYATAKAFAAQGARVVITGRRREALDKAASETGASAFVADQSRLQDIDRLVSTIEEGYGKVDVLFINAGVASFTPIESTTEAQFDEMMGVNFKGAFFTLQKFLPLLADGAAVVLLSSNSASMARANSAVYSASKVALNMLMKSAAVELAPRKIRVNAVSPGPTQTEMMHKFGLDKATLEGMTQMIVGQVPLGKMGIPEDVAKMVLYLADNHTSSFITGVEFLIDGGMAL